MTSMLFNLMMIGLVTGSTQDHDVSPISMEVRALGEILSSSPEEVLDQFQEWQAELQATEKLIELQEQKVRMLSQWRQNSGDTHAFEATEGSIKRQMQELLNEASPAIVPTFQSTHHGMLMETTLLHHTDISFDVSITAVAKMSFPTYDFHFHLVADIEGRVHFFTHLGDRVFTHDTRKTNITHLSGQSSLKQPTLAIGTPEGVQVYNLTVWVHGIPVIGEQRETSVPPQENVHTRFSLSLAHVTSIQGMPKMALAQYLRYRGQPVLAVGHSDPNPTVTLYGPTSGTWSPTVVTVEPSLRQLRSHRGRLVCLHPHGIAFVLAGNDDRSTCPAPMGTELTSLVLREETGLTTLYAGTSTGDILQFEKSNFGHCRLMYRLTGASRSREAVTTLTMTQGYLLSISSTNVQVYNITRSAQPVFLYQQSQSSLGKTAFVSTSNTPLLLSTMRLKDLDASTPRTIVMYGAGHHVRIVEVRLPYIVTTDASFGWYRIIAVASVFLVVLVYQVFVKPRMNQVAPSSSSMPNFNEFDMQKFKADFGAFQKNSTTETRN